MEGGEATVEEEAAQTFKTWQDSAFCRRQRGLEQGVSPYRVDIGRRFLTDKNALFPLLHQGSQSELGLEVSSLLDGIVRLRINETRPLRPRYQVPDVLLGEPDTQRWSEESVDEKRVTLGAGDVSVMITAAPFQAEVRLAGRSFVKVNSRGLLHFEVLQERPESAAGVSGVQTPEKENEDPKATDPSSGADVAGDGLWEETFNGVVDKKLNGPSSVGLDFVLPDCAHVYGIPERATSFRLKPTTEGSPYRMFNLDTFAYELHNPQGLYGAVPLLLAHSAQRTCAIFWLNSSETWVDVSTTQQQHPADLEPAPGQSSSDRAREDTGVRWMSESGVIDAFLLPGPTPSDVFRQYAGLTGTQALPPLFALGLHQSRWAGQTEADTREIDAGFRASRVPCDVLWLDIEHTDGKRYFTWDAERFPDPAGLQRDLAAKGRKMVTIVDPHIKVDDGYFIYSEGKASGYFIKNPDGTNYEGRCWPGLSSYLDVTNPDVRDWYASKFDYASYKDSTPVLFTWNDMNEPAVFHSVEKTVPRSCRHWGGWEHRDTHNLYGFYQQMASAAGLVRRSGGAERPFVLTRSFFAGSQRYSGAVWTGDSLATWDYLRLSTPMLLSLSVCGISLCGADVGGFYNEPQSREMVLRWFQAGSLQPFFRVHSAKVRREPWLMGPDGEKLIRRAVALRYSLLPYWYTQFYQAHRTGQPVMRPLWVEFPSDEKTFDVEDQYMIGAALLARPVTEDSVKTVQVYFPGRNEVWYDVHSHKRHPAPGEVTQRVNMSSIPLYQRGGTIVPQKLHPRDSTELMKDDPYTLLVAVDQGGCAEGELFLDDGHSFLYETRKQFLHRRFSYSDSTLACSSLDPTGSMDSKLQVEKVVVVGVRRPKRVLRSLADGKKKSLNFEHDPSSSVLVVKNACLPIGSDWSISLLFKQGHKSS